MVKRFILMYHGGITEGRGIENIIKTVGLNKNIYVVILGYGDDGYVKKVKNLCRKLGVFDRVMFHSAVPQDELWKYVGAADLELMLIEATFKSYYLSLPNKFFESVQSLTPMLASNFPEMKKLIDEYDIGMCCVPDDINAINSSIEKIRTDADLYEKYKRNLVGAKEDLCWENEKKVLKSAYSKIMPSGGAKVKLIKLIPSSFEYASRDKRELETARELGWDVSVACPLEYINSCKEGYRFIGLKRDKITYEQSLLKRRMTLIKNEFSYVMQIRRMKADIFSCHDIGMLRRAWFAFIGKKRPMLVYDSHEFELEVYTARPRGKFLKKCIAMEEKFLMKRCVFSIMVNDSIAEEVTKIHKLKEKPIVVRNIPHKYSLDMDAIKNVRREFESYFER